LLLQQLQREKAGVTPAFLLLNHLLSNPAELLPAAAKMLSDCRKSLMVAIEHWKSIPVLPTF
jgi:hypothetical protein